MTPRCLDHDRCTGRQIGREKRLRVLATFQLPQHLIATANHSAVMRAIRINVVVVRRMSWGAGHAYLCTKYVVIPSSVH